MRIRFKTESEMIASFGEDWRNYLVNDSQSYKLGRITNVDVLLGRYLDGDIIKSDIQEPDEPSIEVVMEAIINNEHKVIWIRDSLRRNYEEAQRYSSLQLVVEQDFICLDTIDGVKSGDYIIIKDTKVAHQITSIGHDKENNPIATYKHKELETTINISESIIIPKKLYEKHK